MSKASAPGKIILFGEHFVVYGIKAVLCAIDKRVAVVAEKIPEEKIHIISNLGEAQTETNIDLSKIESKFKPFYFLANELIKKNGGGFGLKIKIDSDIPPGVGLGSSSACCVAAAAAISGIFSKESKENILKLAIEAEKTIFPNTSGADCTICTYGGLMTYDKANGHSRLESDTNFRLVISNSKLEHSTKEVVSNVKKFKEQNEEGFSNLCQKEDNLVKNALLFLQQGDLIELGKEVKKNQEHLEVIGVSNEKLNQMVEIANKTSFGAKITGAGGGGCIYALTDKTNFENTMENLEKYDPFSTTIDKKGLDTFY